MALLDYITARPDQLEAAINEFPAAYVPFGSLEWHGPHLPLGFDGLKAEALLHLVAKRIGKGVMFPTVYWHAFDLMKFPYTPSFKRYSAKRIAHQLYKMGFRVIIMLTGHYPTSQINNLRCAALSVMRKHPDAYSIGIPEQYLLLDHGYYGDHAAKGETSLGMALLPGLTDITAFPAGLSYIERAKHFGVMGEDPRFKASKEYGDMLANDFVDRLVKIIDRTWNEKKQSYFLDVYKCARKQLSPARLAKDLNRAVHVLGMDSRRDMLTVARWFLFQGARMQPRSKQPPKSS